MREQKIIKLYKNWDELNEKEKGVFLQKELENEFNVLVYQDLINFNYNYDLTMIQKKHDLLLSPIYTFGSQHSLLGFESIENKHNKKLITYKDQTFFITFYLSGIKRFEFDIETSVYDDESKDSLKRKNELKNKIESFIKDFLEIYNNYEDYFMYGFDENYKDYVLDICEDQEYLIQETVV